MKQMLQIDCETKCFVTSLSKLIAYLNFDSLIGINECWELFKKKDIPKYQIL